VDLPITHVQPAAAVLWVQAEKEIADFARNQWETGTLGRNAAKWIIVSLNNSQSVFLQLQKQIYSEKQATPKEDRRFWQMTSNLTLINNFHQKFCILFYWGLSSTLA
jgi:hypothetical protein